MLWKSGLVLSLLLVAPAAAKSRIVVIGINASSEALRPVALTINEQVMTDLGREERLDVLGTSDVQDLIGLERQKQLMGCSDSSTCMVEISSALGAPWLVSGSLGKLGKAMRLDLKLIRTRDGKVVFRDGKTFKDESDVYEAVSALVTKMLKAIDYQEGATADVPKVVAPVVEAKPATPPADAPPAAPPPAVAQPVAPSAGGNVGKWVLGGAGLAAAVTGGILLGVGFSNYESTKGSRATLDYETAQSQYTAANGLKVAGAAIGAAGVAALGAALVWVFLPADSPSAWFGIGVGGVQVRGSF
ncbi:MAG: hypothetical protein GQE15_03265 [Archangiaceae bacterium]|nr:hypothetical protein [Archangiaceae bacterium]